MPSSSRDLDDALLAALERADLKAAAEALKKGADPNATRGGHAHALQLALDADMAERDAAGPRAAGDELIELLFDAGADRTRIYNSLHWAVELGRADLVGRFLAEPIEEDQRHMLAALCRAADMGREDVLDILLASGMRPAVEPSGSPVVQAMERGHAGIFRRFIDRGLWLDAKDILGRTPLHVAALGGDLKALRRLLEAGATVDVAASFRDYKSGGRIERTYERSTALHLAVRSDRVEIAEALLDAGADFDLRDGLGRTALDWARKLGRKEIAETLRARGARAAQPPAELAAVTAAESGNAEALAAALDAGAAADVRDIRTPTRQMTPLMLAAREGCQ